MEPKPKGWASGYGAWFEEASVVERYGLRPPYPDGTFALLASLVVDSPRVVLDAGCGPGDLARSLAPLVDRVDAVDRSELMIARGQTLAGADAANLRWINAAIEDAPLEPPYALIVAGDSVHWFDWRTTFQRFCDVLSRSGSLALVTREWSCGADAQLRKHLTPIYSRHGANPDFAPLSAVTELERRGLFERVGEHTMQPEPWTPTFDELIGCHHSQNGFVLEKMQDPSRFDAEVRAVVDQFVPTSDGRYQLSVVATISWGQPHFVS